MHSPMSDLVLLTGATGFLATHCLVALTRAGYRVRGTVRSLERGKEVVARLPVDPRQVELVVADLSADAGWAEATRGCRFVMHTASPVPTRPPKDPQTLIGPAREGTLRVLRAAVEAKVERVVMTSSTAAVLWGHRRDGSKIYDERDWSQLTPEVGAYEQSKTLAERAAWDFIKGTATQLVAINPAAIVGPLLHPDASVSGELVRLFLTRKIPGAPDLGYSLCDVRDVAELQVRALTQPGVGGQRFLVASPHVPLIDVARVLAGHFGPRGFKVPVRRIPNLAVKLMALWDDAAKLTAGELGKRQDVSDARVRETFAFTPRDVKQALIDMGESMIQLGVVAAPR